MATNSTTDRPSIEERINLAVESQIMLSQEASRWAESQISSKLEAEKIFLKKVEQARSLTLTRTIDELAQDVVSSPSTRRKSMSAHNEQKIDVERLLKLL